MSAVSISPLFQGLILLWLLLLTLVWIYHLILCGQLGAAGPEPASGAVYPNDAARCGHKSGIAPPLVGTARSGGADRAGRVAAGLYPSLAAAAHLSHVRQGEL